VAEHFQLKEAPPIEPRYNIAPSQKAPVIRPSRDGSAGEFVFLRWGLIPSWAKDPKIGYKMINARAETLSEKPAFRVAFKKRRCLIPANGFYEWKREWDGKRPYFIGRKDGGLFAFAGLWERWKGPDEEMIESCVIVTAKANATVAPLHDRMPVIVPPEAYRLWMDTERYGSDEVARLLVPAPEDLLNAYPVSRRVNNPENDDKGLIEPVEQ
jgi:putative SOS response-associated peptidase YedK